MYKNYVGKADINKKIFMLMIIIWSMYGFAAMFSTIIKNISYNILDIISKNFYGLYLFSKVRNIAK